jgi:uncharacterized protein YjbI with pentapeptide repeats
MVKLQELLARLFSEDNAEIVKTVSESGKAVIDVAKAIQEKKDSLQDLQPYLGQISSLLDVLNSPLVQVAKETIPFAPLAMTLLRLGAEGLQRELSLEECVGLMAQGAYLASLQAELNKQPEWLNLPDSNRESNKIGTKLKNLGAREIDRHTASQIITALPLSDLVSDFNQILGERLVELGVAETQAKQFADRVAWNAPRHLIDMVAENEDNLKQLTRFYESHFIKLVNNYETIDSYLKTEIQTLPAKQVFDESDLELQEIYVPLEVKLLTPSGKETTDSPIIIHDWAIERLNDSQFNQILFIQGEAGRGKSVFCRMFADRVRQELAFIPIFIRLREISKLGNNFTATIEDHLENLDFTKDDRWLTNKNQRFLFLLDGFDELLLQGRSTGGLKEFLEQVEKFQADSHHRLMITGRPLAIQGLERSTFQRQNCLARVKLIPMNDNLRNDWLQKWAVKVGDDERKAFEEFLQACPDDIKDRLAREPLLLYVLGRIHREGAIQVADLQGTDGMATKVKVYDKTVEWVLARQRDSFNQRVFDYRLEISELRQLLTEVAVCVVQSGNEIAKVSTIEHRLTKDCNNNLDELFAKIREPKVDDTEAINNLLTTFYISPAPTDPKGSVEFAHKSFGEFLFAERIKEAIADWSSVTNDRKGRSQDQIEQGQFEWQIYDLLGSGCLTPDIVDYLREMLAASTEWQPGRLFDRLNDFWESWCEGEFIDKPAADNLPQKKMQLLKEQIADRELVLGIRQVDLDAGLNVLILLLELHRYSQGRDEWRDKIIFYPSGQSQNNSYSTRLLKVIHYSESIEIGNFHQNIGSFLRGADLSSADLRGANLSSANLSSADLRGAYLRGADLSSAYLSRANLSGADLSSADLSSADLSGAYLRGAYLSSADLSRRAYLRGADLRGAYLSRADLSRADLRSADLRSADLSRANLSRAYLRGADLSSADLSSADLHSADLSGVRWNDYTRLQGAIGLETAIDMPADLSRHLGRD